MSQSLTPKEFDAHLADKTLRLSLVGMSNGGKSYRSRVLRDEESFLWYHVDDEIQAALGFDDIESIASWLGYPADERYAEHERAYLELENRFTKNASMQANGQNLVFDTTGSVVHLEPDTLALLRENTLVVHLDVGDSSLEELIQRFYAEPKPVAWCGYYHEERGEATEAAIRHSYPTLLAERLKRYRELAQANIPVSHLRDATGAETLAIVRSYL